MVSHRKSIHVVITMPAPIRTAIKRALMRRSKIYEAQGKQAQITVSGWVREAAAELIARYK